MSSEVKNIPVNESTDETSDPLVEEPAGASDGQAGEAEPTLVDQAVVQEFERELAEARRRADENHDKYLRAVAELENVRKRLEKTYRERVTQARRELLLQFLEVADNLERAIQVAKDGGDILDGVQLTYRQLERFLAQEGVEPIAAVGEPFDPMRHEAVSTVPMDGVEDETVVAEDRRGYTYQGELLRPSRVHVAKKE